MLLLLSMGMAGVCVFGEGLFVWFALRVWHGGMSVCECASFHFGFEGGMWDLIVLVLDHCHYFYFSMLETTCRLGLKLNKKICLGEELYKYSFFRSDPLICKLQMHMFVDMFICEIKYV